MKTLILPGSRPIGAPQGWDQTLDGPCGVLFVIDAIEVQSGHNVMYSFYRPTPEDLEALQQGGMLRLGVMGLGHPVITFGVMGKSVVDAVQPAEGFDMGPVIELPADTHPEHQV
jgi:hypothetical protein